MAIVRPMKSETELKAEAFDRFIESAQGASELSTCAVSLSMGLAALKIREYNKAMGNKDE